MATTRIKVPRLHLIERTKAKMAEEIAEHAAEMKKYEDKIAKIREAFLKEVTELASTLSAMSDAELIEYIGTASIDRYSKFASLNLKVRLPQRPYDADTRHMERSLRILEASTDEVISVSTHDAWYGYL